MAAPLMPKATAVWLIENTTLTFDQIAEFCGLHRLEVQAIADGEVAPGMQGLDPIVAGEVTMDEIRRCEADPNARMIAPKTTVPQPRARPKGARYTPVAKRQDRPDAIAWLLKNYPELSDAQISKLVGTTKTTIASVRDRTHWNASQIKPQNPVNLGICSSADLEKAIQLARARAGTVHGTAPAKGEGPKAKASKDEEKDEPAGNKPAADEPGEAAKAGG
ncbi:MAG: DUF1013 domain-containing protein [Rhodospirillales bacterium]|nr:DUF1013 domain-containing protein [Rhodospirillales bacterium]